MRDTYIISGSLNVTELEWKLNVILQTIGDRLDAVEGIRPEAQEGYVLTAGTYKEPSSYSEPGSLLGVTAYGRTLINSSTAAAARTILGLGEGDTVSGSTYQRSLVNTLDFNNVVIHQYPLSEMAISSETHGYY